MGNHVICQMPINLVHHVSASFVCKYMDVHVIHILLNNYNNNYCIEMKFGQCPSFVNFAIRFICHIFRTQSSNMYFLTKLPFFCKKIIYRKVVKLLTKCIQDLADFCNVEHAYLLSRETSICANI